MENTLGLDVHGGNDSQNQAKPSETEESISSSPTQSQNPTESPGGPGGSDAPEEGASTTQADDKARKDKGKPYVPATPAARTKMSPEELAERMDKIRLQNEKIKERREHVKADEEAFNTSIAADRAKQAASRKVQAQINQDREQNAKRKLEKMGNREWDSGKQGGEWKQSGRGRGKPSPGPYANSRPKADAFRPLADESINRPSREVTPQAAKADAPPPHLDTRETARSD